MNMDQTMLAVPILLIAFFITLLLINAHLDWAWRTLPEPAEDPPAAAAVELADLAPVAPAAEAAAAAVEV